MKSLFIISIALLLSITATAQTATAQDTILLPRFNIKYNLTSILDITAPYLGLSAEYPIAKRVSLEHELSYTYNRFDFIISSPFAGIRSRNQLHLYLPHNFEGINFSIDLHLVGKYVFFPEREYPFSRFNGQYIQKYYTSRRSQDIGFLIGSSLMVYITEIGASLELGTAIGSKRSFSHVSNRNIPEDARMFGGADFSTTDIGLPIDFERNIFVIALINFKLGILF
ncbi:MAG: hypothetical protein ACPGXZ_06690 [Saprospiraceae bacterium]